MKKAKIDYTYFFNKSMETNVGMAACLHNISFRPEKNNFCPEKIKILTEYFAAKKREATLEACFPN